MRLHFMEGDVFYVKNPKRYIRINYPRFICPRKNTKRIIIPNFLTTTADYASKIAFYNDYTSYRHFFVPVHSEERGSIKKKCAMKTIWHMRMWKICGKNSAKHAFIKYSKICLAQIRYLTIELLKKKASNKTKTKKI